MTQDILILCGGLVLLVGGGDALVRGAASLAGRFGISPLVVGLTVVAFGTSAPELAVNVTAALSGSGELSFGNITGSNIANIGLVIGVTALFSPVGMHRAVITREIPMMTLASLVALVMGLDLKLGDGAARDAFGTADGLVLLLLFCVFVYYTVNDAMRQRNVPKEEQHPRVSLSMGTSILFTLLGLAGLGLGGNVTVRAAVEVARALGMSEALIGMTIVAIGTSLPELVTSLVSVVRGETDLAVGNVVGSNIFNLLFVLGITSVIAPVPLPAGGQFDLVFVTVLSMILLPLARNPKQAIPRVGGLLLFASYVGYLVYRAS